MSNVRLAITVAIGLLFIVAAFAIRLIHQPAEPACAPRDYQRIVSTAPSLTETLFALGLGDHVVGVTRYCSFPPEAAKLPKVGGYADLDAEAIVRLNPDLVVTFPENDGALRIGKELGIPVLALKHGSLDHTLESIARIGRVCKASARAQTLLKALNERIDSLRQRTADLPPPRVLVVLGRERASGGIRDVTVAGKDALYDRILEIAGATNACEQSTPAYPLLSAETILRIDPDFIVELAPEAAGGSPPVEAIREDWKSLGMLSAVKGDRIVVLVHDDVTRPGPRIVDGIERLAKALHPELSGP